jgi:hypothetical protein
MQERFVEVSGKGSLVGIEEGYNVRLRLPFCPEDEFRFPRNAVIHIASRRYKELPVVASAIPTARPPLEVVGAMLPAGMEELNEAAPILQEGGS